jgi:hypothetical protein
VDLVGRLIVIHETVTTVLAIWLFVLVIPHTCEASLVAGRGEDGRLLELISIDDLNGRQRIITKTLRGSWHGCREALLKVMPVSRERRPVVHECDFELKWARRKER